MVEIHDGREAFHALAGGTDGRRMMVVVAHPDDETIGMGGQLQDLPGITVVHVTDGAPRTPADARRAGFTDWPDYAAARRREVAAAMSLAGIPPEALVALDIADQGASEAMASAARSIAVLWAGREIRTVFSHAFEGGHPDHDASSFAVHAAARLLARDGEAPPSIVEMPLYRAGPSGFAMQDFVPDETRPQVVVELDEAALALKRRMLAAHATQWYLLQRFASRREFFRRAPDYDFTHPPNDGAIHYERQDWGMTWPRWRDLAAAASRELGL
jgi:N-acetylglucosamine malate deacetylase 2